MRKNGWNLYVQIRQRDYSPFKTANKFNNFLDSLENKNGIQWIVCDLSDRTFWWKMWPVTMLELLQTSPLKVRNWLQAYLFVLHCALKGVVILGSAEFWSIGRCEFRRAWVRYIQRSLPSVSLRVNASARLSSWHTFPIVQCFLLLQICTNCLMSHRSLSGLPPWAIWFLIASSAWWLGQEFGLRRRQRLHASVLSENIL